MASAALTQVQSDAALRFGGAVTAEALQQVAPSATVSAAKIKAGLANTELVVIAGLAKSKSEAFRLIEQGGVTINDVAVSDPRGLVTMTRRWAIASRFRKGRRSVAVVEVTP